MGNIDAVSNFFAKKVESGLGASEHSSVDKVVQIIREACLVWGCGPGFLHRCLCCPIRERA